MGKIVKKGIKKSIKGPIQDPMDLIKKGIKKIIPTPKTPAAPGAAAPPTSDTAAVALERQRNEAAAKAESKARGRAATLLTGGRGLLDDETESRRLLTGR